MSESHKCIHNLDGTPLSPEFTQGIADTMSATLWIEIFSVPKLWSALRRIPPKAFLIERIDAWLAFARKIGSQYYGLEGDERAAAIEARSLPFLRLRNLLVDWDLSDVNPEIREAAHALHIAEFQRPPPDDRDLSHVDPPIPLEATLIWPEGEWDEEAFLAGRFGNEAPSGS